MLTGQHGLPLMGGGDWNDGMDKVGENGGESVWLAWFTAVVVELFIPLCQERAKQELVNKYKEFQAQLIEAVETSAWDGEWYCRARKYFV